MFFFKSLDGGSNWIGPTRVNDDPSTAPANRDCGRGGQPACPAGVNTGNDKWWPWIDVNDGGHLNVVFKDRRLDMDSMASEWPTSRARPGNYLVWTWGGQCTARRGTADECVSADAAVIPQPAAPSTRPGHSRVRARRRSAHWDNFGISDVPSNWTTASAPGSSAGDYESVPTEGGNSYTFLTDARNGRSAGGPAGGATVPSQPGRNPACEQADVFYDTGAPTTILDGQKVARSVGSLFLVTPCPKDE